MFPNGNSPDVLGLKTKRISKDSFEYLRMTKITFLCSSEKFTKGIIPTSRYVIRLYLIIGTVLVSECSVSSAFFFSWVRLARSRQEFRPLCHSRSRDTNDITTLRTCSETKSFYNFIYEFEFNKINEQQKRNFKSKDVKTW